MPEIAPITQTKQQRIIHNVLAACNDINKLNLIGYNFICHCPGFIAHCDLPGFIGYYDSRRRRRRRSESSLKDDILAKRGINQWRNFRKGEPNAAYYHSKRDVYNKICEALTK